MHKREGLTKRGGTIKKRERVAVALLLEGCLAYRLKRSAGLGYFRGDWRWWVNVVGK